MLTGASTAALADVTSGTIEAGLIGVAVLSLVAGIAIYNHIRDGIMEKDSRDSGLYDYYSD